MSLLSETQTKQDAAPSKWAGKVHALGAAAPWWESSSVLAVVEVEIAATFRVLMHVTRSTKNGRLWANPPSTKRDGAWVPVVEFVDPELGKVVHAVAVQAAETFLAVGGAGTQPDAADDDMPF